MISLFSNNHTFIYHTFIYQTFIYHTFIYHILYFLLNINTIILFRSTIRTNVFREDPYARPTQRGVKPYLSVEEEDSLVKWAMNMGRRGIPQSEEQLCKAVQHMLNEAGRKGEFRNNNLPTKGWVKRLLGRYPDLAKKRPQAYDSGKMNVTFDSILEWFSQLDEYLEKEEKLNVKDFFEGDGSRMVNIDETGVKLNACQRIFLALVERNSKVNFVERGGKHKQMTVMAACAADGTFFKPMIIFPTKSNKRHVDWNVADDLPEDCFTVGRTESGWMTGEFSFS